MNELKVLGLITARGGSKGIPGKNIKLLGNMPLVGYVAMDGLKAKLIDNLVISTDDDAIAQIASKYGVEVPFMRPKELAADNTPSLEVIQHALDFFDRKGEHYDAVCLLQPTSPFKPERFIDECIDEFCLKSADALISVLKVPHHLNPHWTFEENSLGLLSISTGEDTLIPRRQELPKAYFRDGSVYVIHRNNIKKGALLEGNIAFKVSDSSYYCNLDTLQDWEDAMLHPARNHYRAED